MRISDWSSDVCSSDLFHDQDRGAKVKASELICDPIHPPMAPQHRQAEQRQSRTDISAPGKAFGTPGNVRQNRSEEHTTELQSLMRIPYAVIRLNKNNIPTYNMLLATDTIITIIHHTHQTH